MSEIEQRMSDALSARLKHDRPNRFDPDTWLEDALSKFYPDETFVDLVVLQETQTVCSQDQLRLAEDTKRALAADVNLDSSGQDAVDSMVDAHANGELLLSARAGATSNQLIAEHLQDMASTVVALGFSGESNAASTGSASRAAATRGKKRGKK